MKKKELYEAPSVETYDLVPDSNLLNQNSPFGESGKAGGDLDMDKSENNYGDLI